MYPRDSRASSGAGILVQDHGWKEAGLTYVGRICEYAERWVGRGEFGEGTVEKDSLGDVHGLMIWKKNSRQIPVWRHAFPVVTAGTSTQSNASRAPDDPDEPDDGSSGGAQISRYYPVGAQPESFVEGGITYTLSGGPTKTYLSGGGAYIGAYVYTASGPASGPKAAAAWWGTSNGFQYQASLIYINVWNANPFGATANQVPPTPTPPAGYTFTGNVVPLYAYALGYGGLIAGIAGWQFEFYLTAPGGGGTPGGGGGGTPGGGGGGGGGNHGTNSPTHPGSDGGGPDLIVVPTKTTTYAPDFRLQALAIDTANRIPGWPRFPRGCYGIVLETMDEDQQIEQFHPTDPRLPCVNFDGGPACGALVVDLKNDSGYDDKRMAHLQSALRVVKGAQIGQYANQAAPANILALQFGDSGQKDSQGGLVFESDGTPGGGIGATWSQKKGGALFVGSKGDKHKMGVDADANPINALHIHTSANFYYAGSFNPRSTLNPGQTSDLPASQTGEYDGPLGFEVPWPNPVDDGNFPVKVHMGWNPNGKYTWNGRQMTGRWEWWMKILVEATPVTTPSGPPREPTDPPPPPVGPGPTTPGGIYDPGAPPPPQPTAVFGTTERWSSSDLSAPRRHGVMVAELANPGFLARPQRYAPGETDTRYYDGWSDSRAVDKVEHTSPVVGRMAAFGAQGGVKGGPYFSTPSGTAGAASAGAWGYTQQPGKSRELGGTANGMWLVLPPEVDGADVDDDFAPNGLTRSTTYFAVGPGAYFGSGTPELATGGLRSGFSWGRDGADLVFRKHDAAAAATAFARFSALPQSNKIFAAPASGAAGEATFRLLVSADIPNAAVTLAKLANIADQTILGNNSGGAAAPMALSAADARTVLGLGTMALATKLTHQADSTAATLGDMVNDFNALLSRLQVGSAMA